MAAPHWRSHEICSLAGVAWLGSELQQMPASVVRVACQMVLDAWGQSWSLVEAITGKDFIGLALTACHHSSTDLMWAECCLIIVCVALSLTVVMQRPAGSFVTRLPESSHQCMMLVVFEAMSIHKQWARDTTRHP